MSGQLAQDDLRHLIAEAYRYAGVPDPERLAAAFAASFTRGVPSCPRCAAPGPEVAWLGGLPDGSGHWRCTRCAHGWTTPPAGSSGN